MSEGTPKESGMSRRDFLKAAGGIALASILPSEADGEKIYTVEGSPFDPETIRATLEIVAREKHITLDTESDPLPVVISHKDISDDEFDAIFGYPTHGKRFNFFKSPNTIYLLPDSAVHNLAHELTHYVLDIEKKRSGEMVNVDPEDEPIRIQNMFR